MTEPAFEQATAEPGPDLVDDATVPTGDATAPESITTPESTNSPTATATGEVRVDDALAELDSVDDLDPSDQLAAFSRMQARLAGVLDGGPDAETASGS